MVRFPQTGISALGACIVLLATLGLTASGAVLAQSRQPPQRTALADGSRQQVADRQASSRDVYYRNCDAARAAGAAPLYRGEPGYRPPLDADNDGVACEPYRRRR